MDVRFFLGANSGVGFYSLYDGFCAGRGDFLNLIKAGPGGGKSRFMREIASAAAQRGYDTQCILCSGDPSSLDAVYIPALRLGISCEGKLTLTDSINKLCKRIYVLDDRCFLAREYLDELLCEAKRRQESVIACPSALLPDTLEALLLPQRSLGFVSRRVMQPESAWRHVRLDALVPREST